MNELSEFPFEYVGGGYFRRKGVPKGEVADMLHGQQVVEAVQAFSAERIAKLKKEVEYLDYANTHHKREFLRLLDEVQRLNEEKRKLEWTPVFAPLSDEPFHFARSGEADSPITWPGCPGCRDPNFSCPVHITKCQPHPAEQAKRDRIARESAEKRVPEAEHPGWGWWLCEVCGTWHSSLAPVAPAD